MAKSSRRESEPHQEQVPAEGEFSSSSQPASDDSEAGADFSLATLGRLYAQAVAQHRAERPVADEPSGPTHSAAARSEPADTKGARETSRATTSRAARTGTPPHELGARASATDPRTDPVPVTPASILEAILFVGSPDNAPLTARKAASLIRGVSPQEVEQLVAELNRQYETSQTAYHIVDSEQGYRMVLRNELHSLCARLRGQERPARLSQAAIEVLAVVAYHQPVSGDEVDRLRNHHSGAILSQLTRRGLLVLQRDPVDLRLRRYVTTERFLDLYGLESLADLPQADFEDFAL